MRIFMQTVPDAELAPRYCELILQEDLLGGWSLIQQVGRLGSTGRMQKKLFSERALAEAALEQARDAQLRKGFKVTFVEGNT